MTMELTEMGASEGCVTLTQALKRTLMTEENMLAPTCTYCWKLVALSYFRKYRYRPEAASLRSKPPSDHDDIERHAQTGRNGAANLPRRQ